MKEQIRVYLDNLFQDAPHTAKAVERKGQVFNDLSQRYDELIYQGNDPQTAYNIVIQSVSDVPALFEGLDHEDCKLSEDKPEENVQVDYPQNNNNSNKKGHFFLFPALIVSFALIALVCLKQLADGSPVGVITLNGGTSFSSVSDDLSLAHTTTISATGIDKLDIDLINSDVSIRVGNDDQFVVEEYTNYGEDHELLQTVKKSGSSLKIEQKSAIVDSLSKLFKNLRSETIVYVPASYIKMETQNDVSTISGDINFDTCYGDLNAHTTSGTIMLGQVNGGLDVGSTSGDINVDSVTGNVVSSTTSGSVSINECVGNFKANSISGDVDINSITGFVEASTTSGSINVYNAVGGFDADTISGSAVYQCNALTDNIEFDSTSGSIDITVPEDSSFDFDFDTVSGDSDLFFNIDKDGKGGSATVGSGEHNINIDTVSGDVSVLTDE